MHSTGEKNQTNALCSLEARLMQQNNFSVWMTQNCLTEHGSRTFRELRSHEQ